MNATTSTGVATPSVFATLNRNRLKIYRAGNQDKVYMRNGQEFELELFNPLQETVGAKIFINGKLMSDRMIVLRPGERVYLERFIDKSQKLKFDTYEVSTDAESQKAIEKNGLVRVEFFKEYTPFNTPYMTTISTPWSTYDTTGSPFYNPTFTTTSNVYYTSQSTTANSLFGSCLNENVVGARSLAETAETGRVESGSASAQSFDSYNGSFQYSSFAWTEFQILPESVKPIEVNKIRNYCSSCGNRIRKSSWKFCPGCGTTI